MGNAQEQVKQAADLIIGSNNEDGIAHLIREHILKGVTFARNRWLDFNCTAVCSRYGRYGVSYSAGCNRDFLRVSGLRLVLQL